MRGGFIGDWTERERKEGGVVVCGGRSGRGSRKEEGREVRGPWAIEIKSG